MSSPATPPTSGVAQQAPVGSQPAGSGFDVTAIQQQVAKQTNIVANLANDMLLVAADRLTLRLRDFEVAARARVAWGVPASLALGFLGMLLSVKTVTQIDLLGMNRDAWIGICTIGLAGCVLATLWLLIRVAMKWKDGSVGAIVASLRPPEPKP
jgi:hypothetical protein